MDTLNAYKIDLKNMRTDVMNYQFSIDDSFFKAVEATLVKSGKADVRLQVKETAGGAFAFTFKIKGTVQVPCDRCLDDVDVDIEAERVLRVKLGDEYIDDGDLIVLPSDDAVCNVAWNIYEFIALEVPMTHMHEPGMCNEEMMSALSSHLVTSDDNEGSDEVADKSKEDSQKEEETPIDPRWEKLKKILDNN